MPIERHCILATCEGKACQHRHVDGSCVYEYDASKYESQFRWKGEGPPPRRWWSNGTRVYRSFADYCD